MRNPRGDSQRSGFTLIELILVMVITALLAVSAQPGIRGLDALKVYGAARRLQADLRYTRQLAVSRGTAYVFLYETSLDGSGNQRYRVYDSGTGINVDDPFTGDPGVSGQDWSSGLVVDYTTDPQWAGVTFYSQSLPTGQLRFDSFGKVTSTFGSTITLSYRGDVRIVSLNGDYGSFSVS